MTKLQKQERFERLCACPLCGSDACEYLIYDVWEQLVGCDVCTKRKDIEIYAEEQIGYGEL